VGRMGEKTEANELHATHLHHKNLNICWTHQHGESACLKRIRVSTRTVGYSSPHYHLLFYIGYLISRAFTLLILYHIPYSARSPYVRCHTQPIFLLSFCAIVFSLCYNIHAYMTYFLPLCFASCAGEKLAPFLKNRCLLIAWQVGSYFLHPFNFLLL